MKAFAFCPFIIRIFLEANLFASENSALLLTLMKATKMTEKFEFLMEKRVASGKGAVSSD
jgi:hypothetical protein